MLWFQDYKISLWGDKKKKRKLFYEILLQYKT